MTEKASLWLNTPLASDTAVLFYHVPAPEHSHQLRFASRNIKYPNQNRTWCLMITMLIIYCEGLLRQKEKRTWTPFQKNDGGGKA